MTTVQEAFDAMGFTLADTETVCISFGEERFKEYSLHDVADREIGANVYFSTGTFPVDTVWKKGARAFKNVQRILELPFDFDLKDFLNQPKDAIYDLDDDELTGYMPLLQKAVEDVFARLSLPIHRLDCTGYGLSAPFRQGLSKRAIARLFGISRDSVDKMIVYSVPPVTAVAVTSAGAPQM